MAIAEKMLTKNCIKNGGIDWSQYKVVFNAKLQSALH